MQGLVRAFFGKCSAKSFRTDSRAICNALFGRVLLAIASGVSCSGFPSAIHCSTSYRRPSRKTQALNGRF